MDIAVFGLGYVGTVCAACLAGRGHRVVGCDVQGRKVDCVNAGRSPIAEPHLGELISRARDSGHLSATTDPAAAVAGAEVSLVCVGTPSMPSGEIDLDCLLGVCRQIGEAVAGGSSARPHTVAIRSTVLPTALVEHVLPLLAAVGGERLRPCVNPEFLREGSAVADFDRPPMIVIGEARAGDGDALAEMYRGIDAPVLRMGVGEAVMVKYASNAFHATKIVFANEIGRLCQAAGVDSHQVMDAFCRDEQLNISPRYLRPGHAFGGSCLPKDLRAILHLARRRDVDAPLLAGIGRSNELHIHRCVEAVLGAGQRNVGVLGLSFKDDTDDLRESPTVEIVERLIGKGLAVRIHDKDVSAGRLIGANLAYTQQHLPHLASLLEPTVEQAIEGAGAIVVAKPAALYRTVETLANPDQVLVDLVRLFDPARFKACRYVGLVG